MARTIWFGNDVHQQWVPCPSVGLVRTLIRNSQELRYENGGGDVVYSGGKQVAYNLDFPLSKVSDYEGIEAFYRFSSGMYGKSPVRFVDPMWSDLNLFNEVWSSPGLIETGAKNFGYGTPTFGPVVPAVPTNNRPARYARWDLSTATPNQLAGDYFTFIVPPNHTLHLAGAGGGTGSAQFGVLTPTVIPMTLSGVTGPQTITSVNAGSTGIVVRVGMYRTSAVASQMTISSLWAQIRPTGQAPDTTLFHFGSGHSGMYFAGSEPLPQRYESAPQKLVGLAGARLVEVEPWKVKPSTVIPIGGTWPDLWGY